MTDAFTFTCPECGKTYENVKANMAGRKVSCTCGKVFRLGPKTEEQISARARRKAEKLAAKHPPTLPTVSIPSEAAKKKPPQPPAQLFEAEIPGLEDEVDGKPVIPKATQPSVNPNAFENDPLLENPVPRLSSRPEKKSSDSQVTPPLGWALATPEPAKKIAVKKSETTFERKRGPITRLLDWFANLFSRRH